MSHDHRDYASVVQHALGLRLPLAHPAKGWSTHESAPSNVETWEPHVDMVTTAHDASGLVAAGAAIVSPGSAALVVVSQPTGKDPSGEALRAVLHEIVRASKQRGIVLLQLLVSSHDSSQNVALERSGFRHLTRLVYLRRMNSALTTSVREPTGLSWEEFGEGKEGSFCDALERTYAQSLDCPELTGLRPTKDVLASHRATGKHNPSLWWIARIGAEAAGIILLSRLPAENMLEIVYVGVAQPLRGKGVTDALLNRAVQAAKNSNAAGLTLAVDERNAPARRMYARWNFVETVSRDAWIATPCLQ